MFTEVSSTLNEAMMKNEECITINCFLEKKDRVLIVRMILL